MFKGTLKKRLLQLLALLFVVHLISFHYTRGSLIVKPSAENLSESIEELYKQGPLISSQNDMDDLGRLAWAVAEYSGKKPGSFYVHFIEEMDLLEKFHHLAHQPFTGIETCYTDIWVNSITCYGKEEPSWGIPSMTALRADKFAILQILIGRLNREMSSLSEHFSCYVEIFSGMPVHTLEGRAGIYRSIFKYAKENKAFSDWVIQMLYTRSQNYISTPERIIWNTLSKNPKLETLDEIIAGKANTNHEGGVPNEAKLFQLVLSSMK